MKFFFCIALLVAVCLASYSCERWKYRECRKVGHSAAYCILQRVE